MKYDKKWKLKREAKDSASPHFCTIRYGNVPYNNLGLKNLSMWLQLPRVLIHSSKEDV